MTINVNSIAFYEIVRQMFLMILKHYTKHTGKYGIDQASDRQVFIDQTQSMNLFIKDPIF